MLYRYTVFPVTICTVKSGLVLSRILSFVMLCLTLNYKQNQTRPDIASAFGLYKITVKDLHKTLLV